MYKSGSSLAVSNNSEHGHALQPNDSTPLCRPSIALSTVGKISARMPIVELSFRASGRNWLWLGHWMKGDNSSNGICIKVVKHVDFGDNKITEECICLIYIVFKMCHKYLDFIYQFFMW